MKVPRWIYYNYLGLYVFLGGVVKHYQFMGNHFSVRLFGLPLYSQYGSDGMFWFRTLGGYGLCFKHIRFGLTFSQRIGKSNVWCISGYVVTLLKPVKWTPTAVEDFNKMDSKDARL